MAKNESLPEYAHPMDDAIEKKKSREALSKVGFIFLTLLLVLFTALYFLCRHSRFVAYAMPGWIIWMTRIWNVFPGEILVPPFSLWIPGIWLKTCLTVAWGSFVA